MHLLQRKKRSNSSTNGPVPIKKKGVRRITTTAPVTSEHEIIKTAPIKKETPVWPTVKKLFLSRKLHLTIGTMIFLSLLTTGIYLGYRYLYTSSHFQLKQVEMSPTVHVEREELLKISGIGKGVNIFKVNLDQIALNISKHPWIKNASVWRKLPDTLHIKVQEEQASGIIFFKSLTQNKTECNPLKQECKTKFTPFYLVNSDGKVFKRATPQELKNKIIITGIERKLFETDPYGTRRIIVKSLKLIDIYQTVSSRPKLSEIFIKGDIVTLFLKKTGSAIHFDLRNFHKGVLVFDSFLAGLDLPLNELSEIFMDNRENPNRVVVIPHPKPQLLDQEGNPIDPLKNSKNSKTASKNNHKKAKTKKTIKIVSKRSLKLKNKAKPNKRARRTSPKFPLKNHKKLLSSKR
jgi:POTRA domain, FtsQ-type